MVPYISYFPRLWALYLKRLDLSSKYLIEIIKGLKKQKNKAKELHKEIEEMNSKIEKTTISLGLPLVIAVRKIGEKGKDYIVQELHSKKEFYVDSKIFSLHAAGILEEKKKDNHMKGAI